MRALVTGGAGYIGSHTCKELSRQGHELVVYDNLSRGHRDFVRWGPLVEGDLGDFPLLRETIKWFRPDVVIHFAAFAYVGESIENPALYYRNNVGGTLSLLEAMRDAGCKRIIVSSTCAAYGQPERMPITEETPVSPINPYGESKLFVERLCEAFRIAHGVEWLALRFFNACGADRDCEIGERHDPEPHLVPRILSAITDRSAVLEIYGNDYPTPDGTCIRDYVHVGDLASAHAKAARYLMDEGNSGVFNLGTGRGTSISELIVAAGQVTGREVPHRFAARRPGDPAELVASPAKAAQLLGWRARQSDLPTIIESAWAWHLREMGSLGT